MSKSFRTVQSSLPLARLSGLSLVVAAGLLTATPAHAAWTAKVSYGGSTVMDLYVPTMVDASPGIVVSLHYCSGNSTSAHGWFQQYADQYGFLIIAPSAGGNCFDAKPERSGEREAISKMVAYAVTNNHADPKRVFAAGASSGACMTQALLAAYPDVFAGGSVLAGVPAGAWTGGNTYGWSTPTDRTAAQWGDIVRGADKDFMGARPHVQLWHGTADTTLSYMPNFPAEVAQWTNVLGVSTSESSSFKGSQDTWDRKSYKDTNGTVVLETNVANGAPHDLSGRGLWADVVRFFGLDKDAPTGTGGSGGSGGAATGGAGGSTSTGGTGTGTAGTSAAGTSTGGTGTGVAGSGTAGTVSQPTSGGSAPTGSAGTTTTGTGTGGAAGTGTGTGTPPTAGTTTTGTGTGTNNGSGSESDGGCSYHAPGSHGSLAALLGAAAVGLGVLRRRRRAED